MVIDQILMLFGIYFIIAVVIRILIEIYRRVHIRNLVEVILGSDNEIDNQEFPFTSEFYKGVLGYINFEIIKKYREIKAMKDGSLYVRGWKYSDLRKDILALARIKERDVRHMLNFAQHNDRRIQRQVSGSDEIIDRLGVNDEHLNDMNFQ